AYDTPGMKDGQRSEFRGQTAEEDPHLNSALCPHRSASTLGRLRVFLGIIAVPISTSVPILRRAHAPAPRTRTLSKLRQTDHVFAFYADNYDGQGPMGYRNTSAGPVKQYISRVNSATSGQYVIIGLLYKAGLMDSPAAFFCPSETSDQSILRSSINPWPPGPD